MKQFKTHSEQETKEAAYNLAQNTKAHIFALTGELGAGKTTFVQGFAKGLGIEDKIISPTFVLIRQHKLPNTPKTLFHVDLYRLEDNPNIKELGLEELWSDPNHLVLIEWAEKIDKLLPKETVRISIQKTGPDKRKLTILS
ncbi:tRNA (adenosine(37)-N6)-threonylcarbamoyltransferase complex ATPase subunit type 1 TsaE [Candidatus Daviesbacteria bacterium]|nr:tRNA (adenosine(37)-N6)-threonylcarbamoyltransferase complex ATPase subunit type 1 TsaE [Candidatus Daviesbacteria bacterium]